MFIEFVLLRIEKYFRLALSFLFIFFALSSRSSLLALSSSYIALSFAGAGLGQELGNWTVPDPGALFVTGCRFWPIIDTAQDRTGKVLTLRWLVGR